MSFITHVQTSTCNNFPKILGGTSDDTILYHLDVYNDYLALAGYTKDASLAPTISFNPYLALSSISVPGKYYWAKA